MKKKLLFIATLSIAVLVLSGCTKRCRCTKYNGDVDYYSPEEVKALNKSCSEMKYMDGLTTQRYPYCEWVYGD